MIKPIPSLPELSFVVNKGNKKPKSNFNKKKLYMNKERR